MERGREVMSILPLVPDENGRFIMTVKLNAAVLDDLKKCPDKLFLQLTNAGAVDNFII